MVTWMPVEDPVFRGDQVRHDVDKKNPLKQLRHSLLAKGGREGVSCLCEAGFKPAGILKDVEDLKRKPHADIGPKGC